MDASIARIADFAAGFDECGLSGGVVREARRRVIDTLGCALGGWQAEPSLIARRLALRVTAAEGATVLGTGQRSLPELAAFANGMAGRYLDGNDVFPGGGGHPSDVILPVFAAAEAAGASGRTALAAVALAYDVFWHLFDACGVRERGLDHVFYTAVATAVGAAKAMGLDRERIAQAVMLAVTPNLPLEATRRGALSMWKGAAAANAGRNGVFAALLAKEGMTGPERAIEGAHGLAELLGRYTPGPLPTEDGRFRIARSNLKCFLSEYQSQSPITAALEMHGKVRAEEIAAIRVETYWFAWSEIGSEPEKWRPATRETADHSMPYIVAAVLMDGRFSDALFEPERFRDARTLALADRVTVHENPAFTARFPAEIPCRMEVTTHGGERFVVELDAPRGHVRNPMTDAEVEDKFRALALRVLSGAQADAVLAEAWRIDEAPDLSALYVAMCIA